MIANLKTSIAIVGTAAMLASPALAKPPHHGVGVPAYAYGAVVNPTMRRRPRSRYTRQIGVCRPDPISTTGSIQTSS